MSRCISLLLIALGARTMAQSHQPRYGPQTFEGSRQQSQNVQQYRAPEGPRSPPSAILTHKQAVSDDGIFNYVFAADNGLKQGESIAPDGTRIGAYQYIDPNGKTISVKYTAGKDGFKIIEGDHIPRQPQPVEPIPEYQPPEYRQRLQQQRGEEEQGEEDDGQSQRRPYQQPQPQSQPQRYTAQPQHKPPKQQLFQPAPSPKQQQQYQQQQYQQPQKQYQQQGGQGGYGGQRQQGQDGGRAMLYNVEQRHNLNYKKYQDNGEPLGTSDGSYDSTNNDQTPHTFGPGLNFEIKGRK